MAPLDGVAFVIGAGSGIGLETALTFVERGASAVIFGDRNRDAAVSAMEQAKKLAKHPHYRALAVRVDVTDKKSVEEAARQAVDVCGKVDYFVNTAGIAPTKAEPITEADHTEFQRVIDINMMGTLICIQVMGALMQEQEERFIEGRHGRRSLGRGSITTLVSVAGVTATPRFTSYGASKHAAMGIVKTAAMSLAPDGIRVNAVNPSWVDTPMISAITDSKGWEQRVKALPAGRLALAEEVAGVVHFLSGSDASYISGIGLLVDSGMTAKLM